MQVRGYTISEREASETLEVRGAEIGQGQSSLEAMMTIFMQKMMADEERERRHEEEREEKYQQGIEDNELAASSVQRRKPHDRRWT